MDDRLSWLWRIGAGDPGLADFGDVSVWSAPASFVRWPRAEPRDHEQNCRKGASLLLGSEGDLSCAEIEIVRRFIATGWMAGWLATCGRGNPTWHALMYLPAAPNRSVRAVPTRLLPPSLARVVLAGGRSGWPDVIAWDPAVRRPVFVEAKGPGDSGIAQAAWVARARESGAIAFDDFVRLDWEFAPPA